MDFKTLNQTLNDVTGKAQRSQKLSAKPFLISLVVYGCLLFIAVFFFTLLKDRSIRTLYVSICTPRESDYSLSSTM